MKNYDVENMVSLPTMDVPDYPWNWKLMLENFMEPYHNAYLHKGIHDFALGHGFVEHSPEENVIMHPTGFDRPDGGVQPTAPGDPEADRRRWTTNVAAGSCSR